MILSYRYRMYPNATQTAQLERVFDVACHRKRREKPQPSGLGRDYE